MQCGTGFVRNTPTEVPQADERKAFRVPEKRANGTNRKNHRRGDPTGQELCEEE